LTNEVFRVGIIRAIKINGAIVLIIPTEWLLW